jgi:hypothetical protein
MFRGLAYGDDANLLTPLGVSYGHHLIFKQSEGKKPLFTISRAIILSRDRDTTENRRSISKVDAVLVEIGPALRFVPGEHREL